MAQAVNGWIGYVDRSYEQSKKSIFDKVPYRIPEITDHTENDIFVKMISIWCGILEQLNYYIDSRAREIYLSTLRRFASAVKIAKSYDYRIKGTNPASVDLRFFINSTSGTIINIPEGTELKTKEGIQFFTTAAGSIAVGDLQTIIPAVQQILKNNITIGTTTTEKSQVFEMETNVVDSSIEITINNENWTPVESLAFANATDKVFFPSIDENLVMSIEFGDGINGAIPPDGQPVVAIYYTSSGASGNVGPGAISELISTITTPSGIILQVSNTFDASGGVDIESVADLQRRIPKANRTNYRAVTDQDYIDIAEMVNGVTKAGVTYKCKNPVAIYIVPNGGGQASETLLKSVVNYFENKRINTTKVVAFSAGDVRILLEINVKVLRDSNRIQTYNRVIANLTDFLSETNQEIKGSVALGDIYQVVENTQGVASSTVIKMTILPAAIAVGTAPILLWDREIQPTSTTSVQWKIKIISSTQFQLIKNNQFQGIFTIGTQVVTPEIVFTINANGYSVSNTWTFITYKFYGDVELLDLSIPTSDPENIQINAIGGI